MKYIYIYNKQKIIKNNILSKIKEEMNELEIKIINSNNVNNEYNEIKQNIKNISIFYTTKIVFI